MLASPDRACKVIEYGTDVLSSMVSRRGELLLPSEPRNAAPGQVGLLGSRATGVSETPVLAHYPLPYMRGLDMQGSLGVLMTGIVDTLMLTSTAFYRYHLYIPRASNDFTYILSNMQPPLTQYGFIIYKSNKDIDSSGGHLQDGNGCAGPGHRRQRYCSSRHPLLSSGVQSPLHRML